MHLTRFKLARRTTESPEGKKNQEKVVVDLNIEDILLAHDDHHKERKIFAMLYFKNRLFAIFGCGVLKNLTWWK